MGRTGLLEAVFLGVFGAELGRGTLQPCAVKREFDMVSRETAIRLASSAIVSAKAVSLNLLIVLREAKYFVQLS